MIFQFKNFILHLRLHYQILILSGPYLLGGLFSERLDFPLFLLCFFIIHILLFGGVTAYNSYIDKDAGPVGGLAHPPVMAPWMLGASWLLQLIGFALLIALSPALEIIIFYFLSMFFFWLYSSPTTRWKGKPLLSLIAIGIGTVISSFYLGLFSYGGTFDILTIAPALGAACIVLSMYPVSQIYQVIEDRHRGDLTFAVYYGISGVRRLFLFLYPLGIALSTFAFTSILPEIFTGLFAVLSLSLGIFVFKMIADLRGVASEYHRIMRIKYASGISFSLFIVAMLLV